MLKKAIQSILDEAVVCNENVGSSILVLKDGKELLYCQSGYANEKKQQKIERDTIFRICSMTKPITAVAIMILLEEGKLSLMDPVSYYLSGFKNQKVSMNGKLYPVKRELLVKDLMNMTGGLAYTDPLTVSGRAVTDVFLQIEEGSLNTLEAANAFGGCPLLFQPGEGWNYSVSADVLGAIVEFVSGMKYRDFLKSRIFQPLGMEDTDFYVPKEKQARLARTYSILESGEHKEETFTFLGVTADMDKIPLFESGGAGLASTIDDYGKFGSMLLNKGYGNGVQILSSRAVDFLINGNLTKQQQEMFEDKINWLPGYTYGNLMRVLQDKKQAGFWASGGEYGWDGAMGTWFSNSPEEQMTIIYMVQKANGNNIDLRSRFYNLLVK